MRVKLLQLFRHRIPLLSLRQGISLTSGIVSHGIIIFYKGRQWMVFKLQRPESYTITRLAEVATQIVTTQAQYLDIINIADMNQREIRILSANIQSLVEEGQQGFKIRISPIVQEKKRQLKQEKKKSEYKKQIKFFYFIAFLIILLITFTTFISFFKPTIATVPQDRKGKNVEIEFGKDLYRLDAQKQRLLESRVIMSQLKKNPDLND